MKVKGFSSSEKHKAFVAEVRKRKERRARARKLRLLSYAQKRAAALHLTLAQYLREKRRQDYRLRRAQKKKWQAAAAQMQKSRPVKSIPINIWDDYFDDGFVPAGEKQETNIYVESLDIPAEMAKAALAQLLEIIRADKLLPGVSLKLNLRKKNLGGADSWRILVSGMTHSQRVSLVKTLRKRRLRCGNLPLDIFSES